VAAKSRSSGSQAKRVVLPAASVAVSGVPTAAWRQLQNADRLVELQNLEQLS
jgi:hypothetical protein